jgi:hypothetical protein
MFQSSAAVIPAVRAKASSILPLPKVVPIDITTLNHEAISKHKNGITGEMLNFTELYCDFPEEIPIGLP